MRVYTACTQFSTGYDLLRFDEQAKQSSSRFSFSNIEFFISILLKNNGRKVIVFFSRFRAFHFCRMAFHHGRDDPIVYAIAVIITNAVMNTARSDFSEKLKMSQSQFHSAEAKEVEYKLKTDHRNFLLRHHIQSLVQEISKLKVGLDIDSVQLLLRSFHTRSSGLKNFGSCS